MQQIFPSEPNIVRFEHQECVAIRERYERFVCVFKNQVIDNTGQRWVVYYDACRAGRKSKSG